MLGRQSSLLLTNEDLDGLELMLRARGDVALLSNRPNESRTSLLPLQRLVVPDEQMGNVSLLCFLAPVEFLPRIDIKAISDIKISVETQQSDIIDYTRSFHRDGKIRGGRIYYTPRYFEGDELVDKDPVFVRWAESVVRSVRRSLTYDKRYDAYLGADAARQIARGKLTVIP